MQRCGALRLGIANPCAPQFCSGSAHRTAFRRGKPVCAFPPRTLLNPRCVAVSFLVSRGLRLPPSAASLAALLLALPKALFGFSRRLMRRKAAPMRPARSPATGSHCTYDLRQEVVACAGVVLRPRSRYPCIRLRLFMDECLLARPRFSRFSCGIRSQSSRPPLQYRQNKCILTFDGSHQARINLERQGVEKCTSCASQAGGSCVCLRRSPLGC